MPVHRASGPALVLALLAALVCPSVAMAAGPDELPLSNEAAMSGGAVLAAGRSAGSFWYNPALLGRIHLSETEANGEILGLRWTRIPDVASLSLPDGSRTTTTLADSSFVAVPTTFAGAIALTPKLTLGYGLFQPRASQFDASADVLETNPDVGQTVFQLRHRVSTERYHGGIGLGYEVSPDFQIGASVFAVFDQSQREQQLLVVRPGPDDQVLSAVANESAAVGTFALATALGVRGRLGRIVHAAASLRAPTFVLTQSIEGSQTLSEIGPDGSETSVEAIELDDWRQTQLSGWGLSAGLSIGPGSWLVNLELNGDTGTRPRSGPLGSKPSFGARLGGSVRLGDRASLGAGAFYQSPTGNDESFGSLSLHRFGGSIGVEIRRRLELANRHSIEFRTVVAAWYAHGRGTAAGLEVRSDPLQALGAITTTSGPAQEHLLLLHVGSSIAF